LLLSHEFDGVAIRQVLVDVAVHPRDILVLNLRQIFLQRFDHANAVAFELRRGARLHVVPILGGWGAKQNLFLSHVLQLFESLAQVIEVPLRHHRLRKVFCAHRRSCSDCTSELDTLDGAAQDKLEISDCLLERALRFVAP